MVGYSATTPNVTSAGWQVTFCDPMWHVSSRSGVATLRTATHLLLTYLLTLLQMHRLFAAGRTFEIGEHLAKLHEKFIVLGLRVLFALHCPA